jgi:hypothetical protein
MGIVELLQILYTWELIRVLRRDYGAEDTGSSSRSSSVSTGSGISVSNRYHRRNKRKHMLPNQPTTHQHAFTGPVLQQPPEPPHAERIRTLLSLVSVATPLGGVPQASGISVWFPHALRA